ncbi:MAG: DNA mismatch repair endonuclease MutH [Pantoea sp. Brub]|nr:DNA mismatch repair endonuclease MutH [Pantoea sp. Brub]
MNFLVQKPVSENVLLARARSLSGLTLGHLAINARLSIPHTLKYNKGWVGMLIEQYLGADSKNKSEQDFSHLGIELKTIPVDLNGKPIQKTFICALSSNINNRDIFWETSQVRKKLSKVLWIPIDGKKTIPLCMRRIHAPIIWIPNSTEDIMLGKDWEELADMILMGQINQITAYHGSWLQILSKSVKKQCSIQSLDEDGHRITTHQLGFYLRKSFTQLILKHHFLSV